MFTAINENKSPLVAMPEAMRLSSIEQNKTKNNTSKDIKLVEVKIEEDKNKMI